uniref:Ig-like domain-containing protein n=1 Tax=Knipowitschia caucasica TaxID=637954 RepID=A0AAV2KGM1_KNICA
MCSARNSKDTAQNPQAPWPLVEDPSLERDNRPRRAKGVKSETLTQVASVTVQPGHTLSLPCNVSYSLGSYFTAWIRQQAGKGLEWIGSKYTGASYYKESLRNKFSIDLDTSSNKVTLIGQNMQPADSAVYYCARGTQSNKE